MVAEGEAIRVERPDPRLPETRSPDGALPQKRFKEDYRRTSRLTPEGKRDVYARIKEDGSLAEDYLDADAYKELGSRTSSDADADAKAGGASDAADAKASNPFAKGPLSEREARDLYKPLVEALPDVGHYLDQGLWLYNPAEDGQDIWGEMSKPEAEMLAEALLSWGRRHTVVAVGIRETVYLKKYAAIAAFVIPRGKKTYMLVRTAPRRPRRKLSLFRQEATP